MFKVFCNCPHLFVITKIEKKEAMNKVFFICQDFFIFVHCFKTILP